MATLPDHYSILGVTPSSEDVVVQGAYRALMRRYHPDANPSSDAARKAQAINEAYAVLGNYAKRAEYDRRRSPGSAQSPGAPPPPPPPGSGNRNASSDARQPSGPPTARGLGDKLADLLSRAVLLILIGLGTFLIFELTSNSNDQDTRPKSDIQASVASGTDICQGVGLPVVLSNQSNKRLTNVDVSVRVYRRKHSSPLTNVIGSTDYILSPGEEYILCAEPWLGTYEGLIETILRFPGEIEFQVSVNRSEEI